MRGLVAGVRLGNPTLACIYYQNAWTLCHGVLYVCFFHWYSRRLYSKIYFLPFKIV